ncbi:MAG: hypothetical protein CMP96_10830 [Gammaproteobacteria bacterium]|nr:hypothetical protein [Gammaproteobacteria bacterium]
MPLGLGASPKALDSISDFPVTEHGLSWTIGLLSPLNGSFVYIRPFETRPFRIVCFVSVCFVSVRAISLIYCSPLGGQFFGQQPFVDFLFHSVLGQSLIRSIPSQNLVVPLRSLSTTAPDQARLIRIRALTSGTA